MLYVIEDLLPSKLIINKDNLEIIGGQIVSGEPITDKIDKITMAIQYGITAHNLLVKAAENA